MVWGNELGLYELLLVEKLARDVGAVGGFCGC